ncbi:MAG: hypothetical protein A3I04_06625 [Nitrospinae bacterium RIFCSPLOWO2_02_FULL_39_110]|nr:MAG: hypothetical protein A3D97_05770 [Nitrospinae bacterium RIFCSPHIGHO2_12_FULL_39_42]OGV99045.1 MAG: hypothetical protein A2W53_02795 [Nitrospinae bacterium RIFCSPHIGHO2_02_39_11]OGW03109.1 MAG: hypothetical protein A3D20_01895 [Nitrospinae bacterium RIFCSPHIGHO2_02_FULL_39_82]OGW03280.1 MAG: hypothetical protein A2Z59_01770 [Nitrospinae bacterium RIFCSPLOWO2_02_39_17]OGW03639.1 MAG: hypothetical protein A3I04_06625 [Nitrospinae bacterium RIFCSPLOWO2_02_FULL_39_110]OGW07857.1 MAG: hypoth
MIKRIQGTDGVRREVRLSSDPLVKGMAPLEVFMEMDFITEEFMELYTFCHVTDLIERREMKAGEEIVIGWDPRDTEGIFTASAVSGIRKAGGKAVVMGIVPTPAVPIYMLYRDAKCAFMITASHNPKGQNGIKIFRSNGLKFFPEDDIRLAEKIYDTDYNTIRKLKAIGEFESAHDDGVRIFKAFLCDSRNSWIKKPGIFSEIILIIDPANGSLSGIAADILNTLGFKKIIEVNNNLNGNVNLNCGVVNLEGISRIIPDMLERGARFENNQTINNIFEIGRKNGGKIKKREVGVSGAVFDADGDRFYRIDYNPFDDTVIVLSGDETAFLQGLYLMKTNPEKYKGSIYVNTIESDINAVVAAERLGYKTIVTGVGDKWILREAERAAGRFAIGSEESGHNITEGYLQTRDGRDISVFAGNGLKSAINTFAASESILISHFEKEGISPLYFQNLHHPFEPGFKKTFYIYKTDKSKLAKGAYLWKRVEAFIRSLILEYFGNSIEVFLKERDEEPDMLYMAIYDKGDLRGCIFVRNSGTEDKTGINVRGMMDDKEKLISIGERTMNYLISEIKKVSECQSVREL